MATQYHSDDKLIRIEEKLDKVSERIGSIDSTLAAQHVSLSDHIRRTALLEAQIKPIEKHVAQVSGVFKAIGLLATLGAFAEGVVAVLHYLKG